MREIKTLGALRALKPDDTIRMNGKEMPVSSFDGMYVTDTPLLEVMFFLGHRIDVVEDFPGKFSGDSA